MKNVLLVDGLKTNLISISQICDQDLFVNFSHDNFFVLDQDGNCVLKGYKSVDNCYTLSQSHSCHTNTRSDTNLCHEKHSHVDFENLRKIGSVSHVHDLTNLSKYIFGK